MDSTHPNVIYTALGCYQCQFKPEYGMSGYNVRASKKSLKIVNSPVYFLNTMRRNECAQFCFKKNTAEKKYHLDKNTDSYKNSLQCLSKKINYSFRRTLGLGCKVEA